jgi:hypothetical protein
MIEKMKQWLEALEQLDGIDTETECVTIDVGDEITSLRQAIAELESQEPVERDWRKAPWGFGEKRLSTVEYSDIVSDGGLDPRNKFDTPPQRTEQNFCSRCGKRTKDLTHIHTCTPPQD